MALYVSHFGEKSLTYIIVNASSGPSRLVVMFNVFSQHLTLLCQLQLKGEIGEERYILMKLYFLVFWWTIGQIWIFLPYKALDLMELNYFSHFRGIWKQTNKQIDILLLLKSDIMETLIAKLIEILIFWLKKVIWKFYLREDTKIFERPT